MRRVLVLATSLAVVLSLVGCGGGSSGTNGYNGTFTLSISGAGGGGGKGHGRAASTETVTIDRVDVRPATSTTEFTGHWTGTAVIDVLGSTPADFPITMALGSEIIGTLSEFRFHISHVHIVDAVNGNLDADVNVTATFNSSLRVGANRTSQLWLLLSQTAVGRNGSTISVDAAQVLADNNISTGGTFHSYWADVAMFDLTHLTTPITYSGNAISGMWVNGDAGGPYVESSSAGGSWYVLNDPGTQATQGTYTNADSGKTHGAWQVVIDSLPRTGTWKTLSTWITTPTSAWMVIILPNSDADHGIFGFFHFNSSGQIDEFFPGEYTLTDPAHPTLGGTFRTYPAQELLSSTGPQTYYNGTFTVAGSQIVGTFTYTGSHADMPATGSWALFMPANQ